MYVYLVYYIYINIFVYIYLCIELCYEIYRELMYKSGSKDWSELVIRSVGDCW